MQNPTLETMAILQHYQIRANKKYGQNFLTDDGILRGIIDAAGVTKEDIVLEIGPGLGTLTRYLSEAAGRVIAVEIDDKLIPVLQETLKSCENVQVVHADIMDTDLPELLAEAGTEADMPVSGMCVSLVGQESNRQAETTADKQGQTTTDKKGQTTADKQGQTTADKQGQTTTDQQAETAADSQSETTESEQSETNVGKQAEASIYTETNCSGETQNAQRKVKVVANLPYYITTPILLRLFENPELFQSITVMVQKEVAERLQAVPGTKDYGALTLAVQYYTIPQIELMVPPESFIPPPQVDSAVIRLDFHEAPPVTVKDQKMMFRVIRAAFNQRRKTLVNGLKNAPDLPYPREKIEAAIESIGKSPTVRGETLTLEEFARLTDALM